MSFIPLMDGVTANLGKTPETTTADGAYKNEETHSYMEQKNIGNFLKYNSFYKESRKNQKNKRFILSDFTYNPQEDEFTCKQGNKLIFSHQKEEYTASDYKKKVKVYSINEQFCTQCPLKDKCTEGKARSLSVSWEAERLKAIARQNLNSEKGKELRSRRANEVESVFGDEKLNKKMYRYLLRGIQNVNIEAGLYYIAHNICKIQKKLKKEDNNELKNETSLQNKNRLVNFIEYFVKVIYTF
ncbi:MAG: transposase [archaeon]